MKFKSLLLLVLFLWINNGLAQNTEKYATDSKVCVYKSEEDKWMKGTYRGLDRGWHRVEITRTRVTLFVNDKNIEACCEKCVNPNQEAVDFVTPLGTWKSFDSPVDGKPSDSPTDRMRQFFSFKNNQGSLDVIWQDQQGQKIYLSKFNTALQQQNQIALPAPTGTKLLAATQDEKGNYYYAVYQNRDNAQAYFYMCKASSSGRQILQKRQNSDKQKPYRQRTAADDLKLDIWDINRFPSVMTYQNGQVALFIARRLNKSSDGLNHQSGWAVIFDANTLEVKKNFGQTSGHSFDNYLTTNAAGDFLGIDLGDNYPRGIHLHKFNSNMNNTKSEVVYTFKTYHGTRSTSPAGRSYPRYNEISTSKQTFYQWSNDNGTYTELGGVVEVNDGYLVIFAGEPDQSGKSINNARANGNAYCDTRNLGFVKVRKDYENAQNLKEAILSKGISETGRFYDFGGRISEQENQGVVWLTNYKNAQKENVVHIKTLPMPDGNILILYATDEIQYPVYETYQPYMMTINAQGKIVLPPTKLPKGITLSRRDEVLLLGSKVIVTQSTEDNQGKGGLRICALDLKGQKGTAQANNDNNTKPNPTPTKPDTPNPSTNNPPKGTLVNDLEGKKYYIVSADPKARGRCLDADANGLGKRGTKVQLWQPLKSPNQQWRFQKVGDGTYRVLLAAPEINGIAYLNADSYSLGRNGGKVHLWYNNGDKPNQHWTITKNSNGTYTFTSTDPNAKGRCLDASASSLNANGGKIQVWDAQNNTNQQWNLVPVPPKPPVKPQVNTNEANSLGNNVIPSFDENKYYRLTTQFQGDEKSLDIINDGKNNQPILAKTGNYSGQAWKIRKVGADIFILSTAWQGPDNILNCVQGPNKNRPILHPRSGYSGEAWKIKSLGNGYFRITNLWLGDDLSLDVINDDQDNKIILSKTGNYTGQSWKIVEMK